MHHLVWVICFVCLFSSIICAKADEAGGSRVCLCQSDLLSMISLRGTVRPRGVPPTETIGLLSGILTRAPLAKERTSHQAAWSMKATDPKNRHRTKFVLFVVQHRAQYQYGQHWSGWVVAYYGIGGAGGVELRW